MSNSFVKYEKHERTVTITLNRPEARNAINSPADCDEFVQAIHTAQDDQGVSCIILTGAGKSFCAGGDLKGMKTRDGIGPLDTPDATRSNYKRGAQRLIQALWDCELPIIAAINGHAIGLGLDLACICDIRIASEEAKFGSTFIKVGIVPGDGGSWILPRAVGLAKASEMILTGEVIDSNEALQFGLISRITTQDQLLEKANSIASKVTDNPARTLRLSKRLLREGQQGRLSDALELSAAFQALAHETSDHAEAVDAFLEKRPPVFTGK